MSDRVSNEVIRKRCGLKDDIVTRIEKGMLRWFGHLERMNERRITKEIYIVRMWKERLHKGDPEKPTRTK